MDIRGLQESNMFRLKPLFKTAVIIIAAFIFISCGSLRIAYDYSDWYFLYKLDDYFDLTDEQTEFFKVRFAHHLKWHREKEVPNYISFLTELNTRFLEGFGADDLQWMQNRYDQLQLNLVNRLAPDAGVFLSMINPQQIVHLKEQNAERNENTKERLEWDDEKIKEFYFERTVDSIEDWFGDLSDEQLQMVEQTIDMNQETLLISLNSRIKRQQLFVEMLEQKQSSAQLAEGIRKRFTEPEKFRTEEYQHLVEQRTESWNRLIMDMHQLISEEQIQFFTQKLKGYLKDLNDIHREYINEG
jgi:superoxide dismutase